MPFRVDFQPAKWCLMRTDIDSEVKRQRMLVYIKLHNVHVCIYMFMASGAAQREWLSNLCRAARRAQTVGVCYRGVSHTPEQQGSGANSGRGRDVRSRKGKQKPHRDISPQPLLYSICNINYLLPSGATVGNLHEWSLHFIPPPWSNSSV